MRCEECESSDAEFEDPRDPMYYEGVCLCRECWDMATQEQIQELADWIAMLNDDRRKQGLPGYSP